MAKLSKKGKQIMGVVNILIGIAFIVVAIAAHSEYEQGMKNPWIGIGLTILVGVSLSVIGIFGLKGISIGESE